MKLWNSLGRIEEVGSIEQAERLANEWAEEYANQKIVLSWIEGGQQVDRVLHDGIDHERERELLDKLRK